MTVAFRRAYSDAGLRELLSGGIATDLVDDFPFYPMHSPGIATPGKDFLREAGNMAGMADDFRPEGWETMRANELKRAQKSLFEQVLSFHMNRLHYHALYDDDFTMTVDINGRFKPVSSVLGHLWGFESDGPRQARVMVVSKNPGREESEEKRNFVGPTSILFREILDELGYQNYWDWYVTNVVRFPNPLAGQSSALKAAWINDCLPLLQQEIRLVRPEYILLLGTEAIAAVLGKGESYKSTNGRVNELKVPIHRPGEESCYHTIKVVTSLHPAAVAHDPSKRDDLYKALRYFKDVLYGTLATTGDPEADCEHYRVDTADQLHRLVRKLEDEGHKNFALDTEFDGDTPEEGKLHTVQFSWGAKKAAVINLRDERGRVTFEGGFPAARRLLTRLLKGPDKRPIFHYAAADLWWLKHMGLGFLQDQFETPLDDTDTDDPNFMFGWQKLATQGGFDTILAAHAHEETADFGLKELLLKHSTIGNYEVKLEKWKKQRAKDMKYGVTELPGFGACPRDILVGVPYADSPFGQRVRESYAGYDADGTYRLFDLYNHGDATRKALLDHDRFGRNSRIPFWIAMRANLAFYEMHETGVCIDLVRAETNYDLYTLVKEALLMELRASLNWPDFNPSSPIQCKEFLFGVPYNGKVDRATGMNISVRPEGALSLELLPYKSTGKRPKLWDQVRARGKEDEYTPAVDKETLEVYSRQFGEEHPTIQKLLDMRYIQQITRSVLQPPKMVKAEDGTFDFDLDDDGNRVYTRGLLSYMTRRGRVHTNFSQTKETRRSSSWKPPTQNLSKKREPDYMRIAGLHYRHSLRSMIVAPPGHAIVTADYTGAELMLMAVQAGSKAMIDHCRRATLSTKGYDEEGNKMEGGKYPHPDYYDIHANVAVRAFRPVNPDTGLPCREGRLARFDLKAAVLDHLRDAAKPVVFGYAYGMTADAAWRRARENGANVTRDDSQALLDSLEAMYPELPVYYALAAFRSRDPMWIENCYNGRRRTYFTDDQKAMGDLERQFKNFPIQSGVADAMSTAMGEFRDYRKRNPHLSYLMCLMVHDDLISVVPIPQVEEYYDKVVPYCMSTAVDVWPCSLDGQLRDDPDAPYHLTPDKHVYLRWGQDLTKDDCLASGLPVRFATA